MAAWSCENVESFKERQQREEVVDFSRYEGMVGLVVAVYYILAISTRSGSFRSKSHWPFPFDPDH